MKFSMIVNPNAGKRTGEMVAAQAAADLKSHGTDVEVYISEYQGHSISLAGGINPDDVDGVISVGGDGTLFEVLNGIYNARSGMPLPIAQIPVGTGNSFLRDLGITTVEDAVETIAAGTVIKVDLGRFTCSSGSFVFINLLGAGFVSNVAYRAGKYKRLGALSYVLGVLEELIGLKAIPATITIDGVVFRRDIIFVEICNSRFTGGNMMMAPGAQIDDGKFDVVVLNQITRRKLLKLFPAIFSGTHIDDPSVEVLKGSRISIETDIPLALTPDGETFGSTPITVDMLPRTVTMFGRPQGTTQSTGK